MNGGRKGELYLYEKVEMYREKTSKAENKVKQRV